MNREELLQHHQALCTKAFSLMQRKNADYAGRSGEEPFANFTRCEAMGICKTEAGMLVRMTDKMSRLSSFVEAGTLQVKDESVEDTCLDLINYAVLFYSYLQGKKNENRSDTFVVSSVPVTNTTSTATVYNIGPYYDHDGFARDIRKSS